PGQPKALNRPTVHDFCTSDGHTASLSLADGEPGPPRATPLPATGSAPASLPALGDSHPGQTEPPALGICDWWRCRALSCRCDQAAVSTGEEDPLPRAEEDEEATWERAAAGPGRSGAGWRLCSFPCCCLWEPGVSTEESSADSDPLPRLPGPPCRGGRKMPVKKKRKSPGVAAAVAEDGGLKKCKISSYCRSQPPARLISGEEHFSSKKCLAWFYEYAGVTAQKSYRTNLTFCAHS
uniref:Defective in cullin neddylation 1 domain containing 5 n=1 Tax=Equus caballus TaxID=9796 RepID=A0A5F5Q2G1_HORSE